MRRFTANSNEGLTMVFSQPEAIRRAAVHMPCPDEWRFETIRCAADGRRVIEAAITSMTAARFSKWDIFAVDLAFEEAIANAILHGNRSNPEKSITVCYWINRERVMMEVEDEGPGFDPASVPDPRVFPNIERPGGRGILLMHRYMSWVRYNHRGNRVTLCKHRSI